MAELPLFDTPSDPDAWRRVRAPGGYEIVRFDAEDHAGRFRIAGAFSQGIGPNPISFEAFRRRPTRWPPPVPSHTTATECTLYENMKAIARFTPLLGAGEVVASGDGLDLRMGTRSVRRHDDGVVRVLLEDSALPDHRVELAFHAAADVAPRELIVSESDDGRITHRWVVGPVFFRVAGTIRHPPVGLMNFDGTGSLDHRFGTAPMLLDGQWCVSGRILHPAAACAFVVFGLEKTLAGWLIEQSAGESRQHRISAPSPPKRPGQEHVSELVLGDDLRLTAPRVLDAGYGCHRVLYAAQSRFGAATALCEFARSIEKI